ERANSEPRSTRGLAGETLFHVVAEDRPAVDLARPARLSRCARAEDDQPVNRVLGQVRLELGDEPVAVDAEIAVAANLAGVPDKEPRLRGESLAGLLEDAHHVLERDDSLRSSRFARCAERAGGVAEEYPAWVVEDARG